MWSAGKSVETQTQQGRSTRPAEKATAEQLTSRNKGNPLQNRWTVSTGVVLSMARGIARGIAKGIAKKDCEESSRHRPTGTGKSATDTTANTPAFLSLWLKKDACLPCVPALHYQAASPGPAASLALAARSRLPTCPPRLFLAHKHHLGGSRSWLFSSRPSPAVSNTSWH